VLKDVNFIELNKDCKEKIVRVENSIDIVEMINLDSQFLEKHGIMDYSLLLSTENIT
jgi:hypothetical protein